MRKTALFTLLAAALCAPGPTVREAIARPAARLAARPSGPQVVYGEDDRLDYYAAPPALQHAADAVCVLVERDELIVNGDGTVTLQTVPYASSFTPPLCDDERFRSQPTLGECTGFLISPDLVVTAGHCIAEAGDLGDVAFVFGFAVTDPSQPAPTSLPASNVYYPTAIVGHSFHDAPDFSDYTVVRLDRPVAGRDPLTIRRTGTPPLGERVTLIGYPYGLPLKVASGAEVKRVTPTFFEANTDSYVGNSGSPVVDSTSLVVEGLLYFGKSDYTIDTTENCTRTRVLPDDFGSYEGSIMTRDFARFLPDSTDDVRVALLQSLAGFDHVDLEWTASGSWLPGAELDRRGEADDWKSLADVSPDDAGLFSYVDHAVVAGQSYGYRLTWSDANAVQHSAETWVAVPLDLQFSLVGARPNPASARDLNIALSLAETAPGRLGLYDLAGRRLAEADLGSLSAGAHIVHLSPERTVRSGVYWLRLTSGARSASRVVIILD